MLNKFSLTKSVILFRKFVPDCSDVRMITNKVDTVMLTMDDIDSTIRSPSISQKLYKSHTSCWIPFTWLHYICVSSYQSYKRYPEMQNFYLGKCGFNFGLIEGRWELLKNMTYTYISWQFNYWYTC